MAKTAQVSVLYPRKDGATFDLDYYLATHMPLVSKYWKDHGLKGYTVATYTPESPYSYGVVMEFESSEAFAKALQTEGSKEIMDDVVNFSSEKPVLIQGEIVDRVSHA